MFIYNASYTWHEILLLEYGSHANIFIKASLDMDRDENR